ncbi:MAG TPA: zinc-binding dehydrogenase [Candidatus Dormibacteraeota bacterium]|nr:zinc-binding dehydrogenase [Candidatus Dormibacteraeota bacterium]
MRAVVITRHGVPEVLEVQERPAPTAGAGEVLIDVRAAGINFADVMARMGLYADAPKPPCVVGYEVAGTVAAVGAGVDRFAAGDRVIAGTRFGGYASQVAPRADNCLPLPADMSFEAGAAIPVNYGTAVAGLVQFGNLQRGEKVLVHAAAGGVGVAATQIAKRLGAEVWGTASPGKHEAIRALGVDHPLDYTRAGWERGLPTFDLIMDAVGGRSFRTSFAQLRVGGRLVCFGASAVVSGEKRNLLTAIRTVLAMPRFNPMTMMSSSKAVIGLNMLALWDDRGTLGPWIAMLHDMFADGTVRPVVARAFPFAEAAAAHRFISERRNVGKVVLVP